MKRLIYPLMMLMALCLFSCEMPEPDDNNKDDNPVQTTGEKYIVESCSWYTYVADEQQNGVPLNTPIKVVHTRKQGDSKILLGTSQYEGDKLTFQIEVVNEQKKEIQNLKYPEQMDGFQTTIWLDDERTMVKETKNYYGDRSVLEYDAQGKLIAIKGYFNDQLRETQQVTYKGNIQYRFIEVKESDGSLYALKYDTIEYVDDSFKQIKWYHSKEEHFSPEQTYERYDEYEHGPYGVLSSNSYQKIYDENGNIIGDYATTNTLTWTDELNNTYRVESYSDRKLITISEGYNKYTY